MTISIIKSLLIRNNIRMPDRSQYPNLIDRILNIFLRFIVQFDSLERIHAFVFYSPHLEYITTQFLHDLEII